VEEAGEAGWGDSEVSGEKKILSVEDLVEVADVLIAEFLRVYEKARGKVPVVSFCAAMLSAVKLVFEQHRDLLTAWDQKRLVSIMGRWFVETSSLLDKGVVSDEAAD